MSKTIRPVLAASLILLAGTFQAIPVGAQTPQVSESLRKPFLAAQEAQKAKRWPEVIAKAQEVLGSSGRKPDDTYYAYSLLYQAYGAQGNGVEERKALQGMAESGFPSAAQQSLYFKKLMADSLQAKDYDAAIDFGNRLIKNNAADATVYTVVGQSHYLKGDYPATTRFFKEYTGDQIKRGQAPLEKNLEMMRAAYEKMGDKAGASSTLETLVVYYPKPNYWEALLHSVRNSSSLQNRQRLYVYRLMWNTGTLKLKPDYERFAQTAESVGLLAETHRVFDAGLKAGVFAGSDKANAERRMRSAAERAESAKAELAKLEAAAAAAPAGDKDLQLGMTRYAYGEPDKAIPVLQRAIGKGGLQPDQQVEAALMLGITQLRNKDKAGAQKTFAGIKTTDPNWQQIVRFWTLAAK